jgi:hypothetical protein
MKDGVPVDDVEAVEEAAEEESSEEVFELDASEAG